MDKYHWGERTWKEIKGATDAPRLALLPVGATEAHGPHLPLSTDVIIAEAMCLNAFEKFSSRGHETLILPPITYTAAPFAQSFPGTVSVRPETVTALLVDIGDSLAHQQFDGLLLANAHLDPTHIRSLYAARKQIEEKNDLKVIFPDITRKPWALRLTDEFKSGACHAGCYEGSIVMTAQPDLVREAIRLSLPENPASLSAAIAAGKTDFLNAGGPEAYFGSPAQASSEEGTKTVDILGSILVEAADQTFSETSP